MDSNKQDWQTGKSLIESQRHMFEKQIMCDIWFEIPQGVTVSVISDDGNTDDSTSDTDNVMEPPKKLPKLTVDTSPETNSPVPEIATTTVKPYRPTLETEEPESMRLGAHKFVLVARSPVFETMLEKSWQDGDGPIKIEDITGDTFKQFIR